MEGEDKRGNKTIKTTKEGTQNMPAPCVLQWVSQPVSKSVTRPGSQVVLSQISLFVSQMVSQLGVQSITLFFMVSVLADLYTGLHCFGEPP